VEWEGCGGEQERERTGEEEGGSSGCEIFGCGIGGGGPSIEGGTLSEASSSPNLSFLWTNPPFPFAFPFVLCPACFFVGVGAVFVDIVVKNARAACWFAIAKQEFA